MPPTTQSQQLGNFIRERRQARKLSLAQLADALNERITDGSTVEKGYLHRLESGSFRQPRAEVLEALSKVLGVRLADLYALAQIPPAKGNPSFDVYLRTTTGLPDDAVARVQQYVERLEREYGLKPNRKRGRS